MSIKINFESIAYIVICGKVEKPNFVYKKAKVFFSMILRKEGIYQTKTIGGGYCSEKWLAEWGLFVENKKVYEFPHIIICLNNLKSFKEHFKTEKELNSFLSGKEIEKIKWLTLN